MSPKISYSAIPSATEAVEEPSATTSSSSTGQTAPPDGVDVTPLAGVPPNVVDDLNALGAQTFTISGPMAATLLEIVQRNTFTFSKEVLDRILKAYASIAQGGSWRWAVESDPIPQHYGPLDSPGGGTFTASAQVNVYPPPPSLQRIFRDSLRPDRGAEGAIERLEGITSAHVLLGRKPPEITPQHIFTLVLDGSMDEYNEAAELKRICEYLHANIDRLGDEGRAMLAVLDRFRAIAEGRPGGYLLNVEKFVLLNLLYSAAPSMP